MLCIFYIIVVFKYFFFYKRTIKFQKYYIRLHYYNISGVLSTDIFFFSQNSLRWWQPSSMPGLVCEWRGNSDVICMFDYRRPRVFALKPNTWLFCFFSVLYICLKCSKLVRSVFCVHPDVAFVNNKVALTIVIHRWLFYNY